ncbi:12-oxophytodienoate reductase [Alteromonas mediterranea]|jgi:2,4-dienoyl-CoA reductase-like NADH-dependent reductase (Old Yellow Enzyme family)|uniref:12-oxophytodienoate reductase n=2 Tax=Alteromonas mediterranea TaxID=314275 RepID=A0AAC8XK22_9ALTE|nr:MULTISPECIES: NADH:flavin oxidoreductase [Alteromonas]AGP93851.1 NADH-dependent flavin oxidoreductase, Oye family protein [Alteromonas mediterranea U8]MBR9783114.1 NADH:flavin oxidoreductase [Gammaproteobacteria bacterium]MEA3381713.1 NADH:flavin oxidoreductase [Pseudomonadota bacterium]AEA98297.1 12-oxophytodienoate reductase [Alteromonas mediterranea DE]AFV85740.1 NADH-dependent flavin oxidoreductase, Oye family protein [Alteromonas mediterranea DE1]|tara:strand:- start:4381 stop:5478 length:1098 start_codon:yes stop_codon:yes gene_type:complete
MPANALFKPYSQGNLSLTNRIVMAPMTRQFSPNGVPTSDVAGYYKRRAQGGTGLIITEGTTVNDKVATMDANIPQFHGEEALTGWKNVVDEVHSVGGKIMPQLWHVGMARVAEKAPYPELSSAGPSGLFKPGKQGAEPMTEEHIESVIAAFAQAAADAKSIGMDGVEIHGAHGYLIDQFFWEGTNQRTDSWGGSMDNRGRFAVEIIKAIRAATGPDFPIVLRYSQWKQQDYTARLATTPQELEQFLMPLSSAGVDIFHCSQRRYWESEFDGSDLNLAGWTKKITGKPTITVGSVGLNDDFFGAFKGQDSSTRAVDDLLERLEEGEFDLVAVGRALLQDPNWANKIKENRTDELEQYSGKALASLS